MRDHALYSVAGQAAKEKHSFPLLHRQQRKALSSAPAQAVDKSHLLHSCTSSGEEPSTPLLHTSGKEPYSLLLHMQRRIALFPAPADTEEKSPLLRSCTRSGEEPSTPLLHSQRRRALYSAPALAAEKSPLLRCMCRSGEEPSACAGAEKSPLL